MTFNVDPLEAAWIIINVTTLVLTIGAYIDARADRTAVLLLNGHARELAANGVVRRELLRIICQLLLLSIAIPAVFSDRQVPLNPLVVVLIAIPIVLLISSLSDARDRRAMTVLVTADILSERTDALTRIEEKLDENTKISQEASDHADAAYHEANTVNEKIASVGITAETTQQVVEIHQATVVDQ